MKMELGRNIRALCCRRGLPPMHRHIQEGLV